MPLNPRQQAFVREYLVDHNATQAAIRAGYSAKNANVDGPRLLANAGVAEAVRAGDARAEAKSEVTKAVVHAEAWDLYQAARSGKALNVARSSLELVAKLHGYIVEKREVRKVTTLDDLSDEELTAVEMDLARKLGDGAARH